MMSRCPTYFIESSISHCSGPVGFQETAVEKEPFPPSYCWRKSNKSLSLLEGSVGSHGVGFNDV